MKKKKKKNTTFIFSPAALQFGGALCCFVSLAPVGHCAAVTLFPLLDALGSLKNVPLCVPDVFSETSCSPCVLCLLFCLYISKKKREKNSISALQNARLLLCIPPMSHNIIAAVYIQTPKKKKEIPKEIREIMQKKQNKSLFFAHHSIRRR